jgi:ribonuclease BN (tRNA processing enzyme)
MKLHILGCGDAFGSGGRHQSAYLIEAADRLFLLDCGPAALLAMKRAAIDPRRLDVIFLSHLHGDHFGGLPFFLIEYLYREPRTRPLTIAGPPATEMRVRQLLETMYRGAKEIPFLNFTILAPATPQTIEGIEVLPFRVPHQVDDISLGLKVRYQGKQILFSGDSAWTDEFIERARGVDLFLCECSFYREQPGMHVNYQILRANLERLECKKLLLTHLGEEMLSRQASLDPRIALAEDGMVIAI